MAFIDTKDPTQAGAFVVNLYLRTIFFITNTKCAFLPEAMCPEALNRGRVREAVMGKEQPETEDRFGKNVKYGIGNDLGVDVNIARTVSDTPDARLSLASIIGRSSENLHWIDSPEDEGETANSGKEGGSLGVLRFGNCSAVDSELVDDNEIGDAGHCVPAPLGRFLNSEGSKETGENHDKVSDNCHKNAGTAQSGKEAKIEEQEWGGDTPIDITSPVNLTVDGLDSVSNMLVGVLDENLVLANSISDCHRIVGQCSEGGDEGSQNVEQAFLLAAVSLEPNR